jgi:GxxExxY protein
MKYQELTGQVLACAFAVMKELGIGFLESVYHAALAQALAERGLRVEIQRPLTVFFRDKIVGKFIADLVLEDVVVIELKVAKALSREHMAQVINYLKASRMEVGLLLNFGGSEVEYRRFFNKHNHEGRQPAK